MSPLRKECLEASEQPDEQSGPHLPGDSVFAVSDKSCEFEGLLDLLEEDLDGPAGLVELGDRTGRPVEVVGQERHLHEFGVDLDLGEDAAHVDRVRLLALGAFEFDDVVVQDACGLVGFELAVDLKAEVVLRSGHPKDAAIGEVEEVVEVDVGLIEQGDLPVLEPSTKLAGAGVVVMGGFLDDGEARQEVLQVQAHMKFRGGLAPAVLGPVHAVGHQGDGTRIDGVDGFLESPGQGIVAPRWPEPRLESMEVFERRPEELFHQLGIPARIGVAQSVSRRSLRPAQKAQPRKPKSCGVANVRQ